MYMFSVYMGYGEKWRIKWKSAGKVNGNWDDTGLITV